MVLLYSLLQDWLNTRKEWKKSLDDMHGNVNIPGQAIWNLYYISVFKGKNTKTES